MTRTGSDLGRQLITVISANTIVDEDQRQDGHELDTEGTEVAPPAPPVGASCWLSGSMLGVPVAKTIMCRTGS